MGGSRNRKIILITFAFALGFLRAYSSASDLPIIDYGPSTIIAGITEEPDVRRNKINYTVSSDETEGDILISAGKYPRYQYGDTLQITGDLQAPAVFDTFDYAGYLSRYDIYSVMYYPKISLLSSSSTWSFKKILLKIKNKFESQMNRTFSTEPSSSFLAGLLLGSRKGIPEQLSEDFKITGLTHIIAISGYNITILVTILMAALRPLGRKPSIYMSAIAVIIFTIFVGASPAVVRACIMGLLAMLALNSNRQTEITLTLVFTAAIMCFYNPKILFHDVGFQLSFLATMGLIYISPLIKQYFRWLPKRLAIRESVLLTISAQIMAMPIILLNFQKLSLVSPLSNLLIAGPTIPMAMLFGFLGTLASFVYLPLGKLIAYPAYLLLNYIVDIARQTASIPFAAVEITWFSKPLFIIYFVMLSLLLRRSWKKAKLIEATLTSNQLKFKQMIFRKIYLDS